MKKLKEYIKLNIPKFTLFCAALFVLSLIINAVGIYSESFADFFNIHISSVFRAFLAYLTAWFPFSLAETIFIGIIPVAVLLLITAFKLLDKIPHAMNRASYSVVGVILLIFSMFTLNFGIGFSGSTLDEKLGIERRGVTAEQLYDTAEILLKDINRLSTVVEYQSDGSSVMPYSFSEMNEKLIKAYDKICGEYDFIQRLYSRLKPVALSKYMSYTHITGVYSFFTGEANINIDFPDYTIPFTAAHELAHQRGIPREDEANFIAFLVCAASDDDYIKYSGYINLYEYVSNSLYYADSEKYSKLYAETTSGVRGEFSAYAKFFEKYRDSKAADFSDAVNDTYLKLQGTAGSVSYGMVVDLAVAYFANR